MKVFLAIVRRSKFEWEAVPFVNKNQFSQYIHETEGVVGSHPIEVPTDSFIESLWEQFSFIHTDAEGRLVEPFLNFSAGTHSEAVERWFDKAHSQGLHYLRYDAWWQQGEHDGRRRTRL